MSFRSISRNQMARLCHETRTKIPAGLLSAKAHVALAVRAAKRPLYSAGQFDRSAIMSAAAKAARAHQDRVGGTWGEAMSIGQKVAWITAKLARHIAAH